MFVCWISAHFHFVSNKQKKASWCPKGTHWRYWRWIFIYTTSLWKPWYVHDLVGFFSVLSLTQWHNRNNPDISSSPDAAKSLTPLCNWSGVVDSSSVLLLGRRILEFNFRIQIVSQSSWFIVSQMCFIPLQKKNKSIYISLTRPLLRPLPMKMIHSKLRCVFGVMTEHEL